MDATSLLSKSFDNFVYFDLGGVVFEWEKGLENLSKLSNKSIEKVREVFLKYDDEACRGKVSPKEFGNIYERELSFSFGGRDFLPFWVQSFKPITETHKLMRSLIAQKTSIGIITNIYLGTYELALGKYIPDLPYRAVIKSCDHQLIKPDVELLEIAERACGFEKSKIILVDDNSKNLEAARNFGWNAILFQRKRPMRND